MRVSLFFIGLAASCLPFADLSISTGNPGAEFARMAAGILNPVWLPIDVLFTALLQTLAFAVTGTVLAALFGFALATLYHIAVIRRLCAVLRSVHELFWALIFLQMFGLSPLTGILAIALPFAGISAKVYAETLEETPAAAQETLPPETSKLAAFFWVRLPDALPHLWDYNLYRLECALKSSAVLGFIGLPTLGYHLESAFSQGHYGEAAALLGLFYGLIISLRGWARPRVLLLLTVILPFTLGGFSALRLENIHRFLTQDILPAPLRDGLFTDPATWQALVQWLQTLAMEQALPGVWATLILTQIALVATGLIALMLAPGLCRIVVPRPVRWCIDAVAVVLRSTPEFILVYLFLLLWGPSMLPAVVALSLHNGAIIAHLLGRYGNRIRLREDHCQGLNAWFFELQPRLFGPFLAYLFYRWEIILRETAILGIVGIATLGFYIDSAVADIRLDRMMALIAVTIALNLAIDSLSRYIRKRLHLSRQLETCA